MKIILDLLVNSPLYPHWLEFRNTRRANEDLIRYFSGKVLETGAGNAENKIWITAKNKKIMKYIATDYSSWDEQFDRQKNLINKLGFITQALYGKPKDPAKLDEICDALHLPYKDSTFDTYCSFEVLEHINDPERFFREAHRILKKNGVCITSMPFLYREHAEPGEDFQRLTRWGYHYLADKTGFKVEKIHTHSFIGTTCAALINQYVIRKILEGKMPLRIVLFLLSPFIFFTINVLGYVLDKLDPDPRFATRYHVVMRKNYDEKPRAKYRLLKEIPTSNEL